MFSVFPYIARVPRSHIFAHVCDLTQVHPYSIDIQIFVCILAARSVTRISYLCLLLDYARSDNVRIFHLYIDAFQGY